MRIHLPGIKSSPFVSTLFSSSPSCRMFEIDSSHMDSPIHKMATYHAVMLSLLIHWRRQIIYYASSCMHTSRGGIILKVPRVDTAHRQVANEIKRPNLLTQIRWIILVQYW